MGTNIIDFWGALVAIIAFVLSAIFSWNRTAEFSLSLIFGVIAAALTWLVYIVFKIVLCDRSDPSE